MKKKRIIAICFTFMMLYTVSSAVLAASYRMTCQGWSIIGKLSIKQWHWDQVLL